MKYYNFIKIIFLNLILLYFFLYVLELFINFNNNKIFQKTRLYYLNKDSKKLDEKIFLNFGAYKLVDVCKKNISEKENELSSNKNCSWTEVECLGACISAPMAQINDDYYEDLNAKQFEIIIKDILKDKKPKAGSYRGRVNSEPEKNRQTLLETKNA